MRGDEEGGDEGGDEGGLIVLEGLCWHCVGSVDLTRGLVAK